MPLRVVAAIERALEKDPDRRFGSMNQFASELRQCLAELDGGDADRTFVAPSPVARERGVHRVHARRSRRPLYAIMLLLVAAAAIVAGVIGLRGSKNTPAGKHVTAGTVVPLIGVGTSDPAGDGEHDADVPKATDGDPSTYWYTQSYYDGGGSLGKPGVGIVVAAPRRTAVKSVTVTTDTPGYTAEILVGGSPAGPFVADSSSQTVNARTTFALQGRTARFYVVWITNLGSYRSVHVNEVRARS